VKTTAGTNPGHSDPCDEKGALLRQVGWGVSPLNLLSRQRQRASSLLADRDDEFDPELSATIEAAGVKKPWMGALIPLTCEAAPGLAVLAAKVLRAGPWPTTSWWMS